MSENERKLLDAGDNLAKGVATVTQSAIISLAHLDKPNAQYLATMATIGGLHCLAALVANPAKLRKLHEAGERDNDKLNPGLIVNRENLTFAAFVALNTCPEPDRNGDMPTCFGMDALLKALEDTEKFLGKKIDEHLEPTMISAMRETLTSSGKMLDDFLNKK